jgi:hypothetical protein
MDSLKQAYAVLGLPETATREEVEHRYTLLLKKAKAGGLDLSEYNQAYNLIISHELEKASPMEKQSKTSYFFYYYKWHVIITILVLVIAIVTVKGCIDQKNEEARKPPLDAYVMVFGNFFSPDGSDAKLSENLLSLVPDWQRIDAGITYVPADLSTPQYAALLQKAILVMMTEKMDLLILDAFNFENYSRQSAFVPLETLEIWPELKDSANLVMGQTEEDDTPRAYGIDITGHAVFADTNTGLSDERKILALRANAPHPEKALMLMKRLVETR